MVIGTGMREATGQKGVAEHVVAMRHTTPSVSCFRLLSGMSPAIFELVGPSFLPLFFGLFLVLMMPVNVTIYSLRTIRGVTL